MGRDPIWGRETNSLYLSELNAFVTLTRKLKVDLQQNNFVLHF